MKQAMKLREQLATGELLVAPGVYDGLTARIAEQAGFGTLYMTGAGTAAARGYPDYGLLTMTEMVENAGVIARSASVPVIADADTGFGNELNVTRTVREYELRGVAGIHIEDQLAPKKCGHLDGKELVSRAEFIAKIRAAVAARTSPDFVLIARTDARAVIGFDEAIWRANAALDAGADIAFVEAAQGLDEVAAVPRAVHGPCLLNIVRGGKTPDIGLRDVAEMGYRIAILPSLLLGAVIESCDRTLSALRETRVPPASAGHASVRERFRRLGADEWDAIRTRFRDPEPEVDGEPAVQGNAR
ncbi:isocitrate lyase/PEP mutase family protein [Paraburkholderia megapolitana]|uniref:2-Methylisocitrate lyase, PEP mutase family n=1 Tax=Paraburkholderia megapolitana TaxID=420953 RepID=A0A1I3L8C2_9BURK|nr:isocitrate lyase/PEP mutase family protein [Paraburkholderia megapolitana]QDQ80604.1 isocitrate lyase/PEP mutase family protein [Paraburkholderia megapolitana]SFI80958.1 2-Methylisocitrate lyase, PEP mutase family [Paraburkholderia megapolitana]